MPRTFLKHYKDIIKAQKQRNIKEEVAEAT